MIVLTVEQLNALLHECERSGVFKIGVEVGYGEEPVEIVATTFGVQGTSMWLGTDGLIK